MSTFILLFRGVNVGGNNLIPMKALKTMLEREGYHNVKTYIQSGNVVVMTDTLDRNQLIQRVALEFGFQPDVMVLNYDGLADAITANPYLEKEGKTVHFYFCGETPSPDIPKLDSLLANGEEYLLSGKVLFLHAPEGIGRSKLMRNVESCLGVSATGRNLNTVLKLQALALENME